MGNITVAILGAIDYGLKLGKKGTATDITLYNLRRNEDTVTFVEPTRYPERLAPLFYAVSLSEAAIVVVDDLNATLGEILVMLQCCRISSGYFILRNYISKEKIQPLINGTSLENFEFIADDPNLVREKLLSIASKQKSAGEQKKFGSVPVDHAFNVKGVGIVVLGIVMDGVIQKHASLNVLPSAKVAIVRSIQKHDDEFETANEGDRVGLALKNVNVEDLDRGTVLTNDPSMKTCSRLQTQVSLVKYWQTPIKQGMVVHVGHWTQFLTAKIDASIESTDPKKPLLTLSLDKPIVYLPGDKAVLMYLEGAKLRVAGTLSL